MQQVRAVMLAVLEDAIRTYTLLFEKKKRTGAQNRRKRELEQWMRSEGVDDPFRFRTICETLGYDPDYLRRRILSGHPPDIDRLEPRQ